MKLILLDINKSFDLFKAEGSPSSGGGPVGVPKAPKAPKPLMMRRTSGTPKGGKPAAAPKIKPPATPKPKAKAAPKPKVPGTPPAGAASASSATPPAAPTGAPKGGEAKAAKPEATGGAAKQQIVDCPLGGACPNGGRHRMGSGKLQEHTEQAQSKLGTQAKPSEEKKPGELGAEKPAVAAPTDSKIGGVGAGTTKKQVDPKLKEAVDAALISAETRGDVLRTTGRGVGAIKEPPGGKTIITPEPSIPIEPSPIKRVGRETVELSPEDYSIEDPDKTQEMPEFGAATQEIPESGGEFAADPQAAAIAEMERKKELKRNPPTAAKEPKKYEGPTAARKQRPVEQFKNPLLETDESKIPVDSKPMDHYRLAKVARESGDENLAKEHERIARNRSIQNFRGHEEHKELADQLAAEGLHDQSNFHSKIHDKVKKQTERAQAKLAEEKIYNPERSHEEQRAKAKADFKAAKDKHAETKAKADALRAANAEKLKNYSEQSAEYESKKAAAKTAKEKKALGKPPEKPKLEKEIKVPEKPELSEPENELEKLQHQNHTTSAKKLADVAESHLRNNKNLSDSERSRLENVHKMAAYHANVEHTPTAAHKKELAELHTAARSMGIKKQHEAPKEPEVAEPEVKESETAPEAPKPQSDMDHAKLADHKGKVKELRRNLKSHVDNNPDMSPEDKEKANRLISSLEQHENLETMPSKEQANEIKEASKIAGKHGKKPYEAKAPDEKTKEKSEEEFKDTGGVSLSSMYGRAQALASAIAASATSPESAGGIAPAVINYGVSGLFSSAGGSGHRLLQKQETTANKEASEKQEGEGVVTSEQKTSSSSKGGESSSREAALGKESEFTQNPGQQGTSAPSETKNTSEKTEQKSTPGQASQSQSSSQSTSGGQSKGPGNEITEVGDPTDDHHKLFGGNTGSNTKASVPFIITKDQHQQLADLGYSKASRNKMTPEEAQKILNKTKKSMKAGSPPRLFISDRNVIQMHGWR